MSGPDDLIGHFEAHNQEGGEQPVIPASRLPRTRLDYSDKGSAQQFLDHLLTGVGDPEAAPFEKAPRRGWDDAYQPALHDRLRGKQERNTQRMLEEGDHNPQHGGTFRLRGDSSPEEVAGVAKGVSRALDSGDSEEQEIEHGHPRRLGPAGTVHTTHPMSDVEGFLRDRWQLRAVPWAAPAAQGEARPSNRWVRRTWEAKVGPLACDHPGCPPWEHREPRDAAAQGQDDDVLGHFEAGYEADPAQLKKLMRKAHPDWPAHWFDPPESRVGHPGEFMYRTQPEEFREHTLRHGIAPRRNPGMLPGDPEKAVYMTTDDGVWHARPEDGHPGAPEWHDAHPEGSFWKIDVSGLPLTEDRTYTSASTGVKRGWMSTEHIGPERLQVHERGSETGVTYDLPGGGTRQWLPPKEASRPGRGERQCPCCKGAGSHGSDSCDACAGDGNVGRSDQVEHCPGEPQPRRRHWREGASSVVPAFEFRDEFRGSHGGYERHPYGTYVPRETWGTWHAHDPATGEHLGRLDYAIGEGYPGDRVHVQDVQADEGKGGRGVASALMDHVYAQHPEPQRVTHSYRTDEGEGWWDKYISRRPEIAARDDRQRAADDDEDDDEGGLSAEAAAQRVEASMPQPDYEPSAELPVGRGIWYRAHVRGQPLDEAHARSRPLIQRPGSPDVDPGLRGYSAFAHPQHLHDYMHEYGWTDSVEGDVGERDVVAFHGKQTGRGEDNEPLVIPGPNRKCCGNVIHSSMPWEEFEQKLPGAAPLHPSAVPPWKTLFAPDPTPRSKSVRRHYQDETDRVNREKRRERRQAVAASVPPAERTESVRHMLDNYRPYDFGTWDEVRDNNFWTHPKMRAFVDDVRRNGVLRPIPVDYEQDPPQVRNGHTRLLAAEMAGIETVPTRQHHGWTDPDDPGNEDDEEPEPKEGPGSLQYETDRIRGHRQGALASPAVTAGGHQMMSVENLLGLHSQEALTRKRHFGDSSAGHGDDTRVRTVYDRKAADIARYPEAWAELDEPIRDGTIDPVLLEQKGSGHTVVTEGQHRIVRARQLGVTHLPVSYDPGSQEHRYDWEDPEEREDDAGRTAAVAAHFEATGPKDYGMSHRPLADGAPAHDLTQGYAEDIYTHPQYWAGNWPDKASAEGLGQLREARGKPDHPVTIYRASPPGTPYRMHAGDWVSLSPTYARAHAYNEGPDDDWHVHKAVVPASTVRDAGTDQYREQGYWGPDVDSEHHWGPESGPALPSREASAADDYGLTHRPDDTGPPLHDMLDGDMMPRDFYDRMHEYNPYQGSGGIWDDAAHAAMRKIRSFRGKPDRKVTIWRSAPAVNPQSRNAKRGEINHGDWVGISREKALAESYEANDPPRGSLHPNDANRYHLWSAKVPAAHVRNAGGDPTEWGYFGPDIKDIPHIGEWCSHRARVTPAQGLPEYQQRGLGGHEADIAIPEVVAHFEEHDPVRREAAREGDERPFGYYTLRYRTEDMGERRPRRFIDAHTPEGAVAGRMNWFGTTGLVHHIDVASPEDDAANGQSLIGDGRDHQGRGLATAMWDWSQEMSPKAKHSKDQTGQGKDWARGLKARERRDPPQGPPAGGNVLQATAAAGPSAGVSVQHEERPSGGATYPHMHVLTATHPDGTTAELRYMTSKRDGKGIVDHAFVPGGYAESLGRPLVQEARRLHPGTLVKGLPGIDEDWGEHLSSVTSLHRHLTMSLDPADRDFIHDESVPRAQRAAHLMGLMERGGPSMHWASQRGRAAAEKFGDHEFRSPEHTQVAITAAPPAREHVETDPERISRNGGYAYQPPDWEVPLKEGARVTATSVRWRTGDSGWTRHQFRDGHQFTAGSQRSHPAGGQEPVRTEAAVQAHAPLENPHTGGHDWYHGSPHRFSDFSSSAEPSLAYQDDPEDTSHWNTLLGHHFTACHEVAEEYGKGEHANADGSYPEGEAGENIVHARLLMRNPRRYDSEHAMDQEVYEHEWGRGNHIDHHLDPEAVAERHRDDDDGEPLMYHYAGDSERVRGKNEEDAYYRDYHGTHHPYATGWLNAHPEKWDIAQRYRERLQASGHDGVVYGNEFEKSPHGGLDASSDSNAAAIPLSHHQVDVTQRHTGRDCLPEAEAARTWPGGYREMSPLFGEPHQAAIEVVAHFEDTPAPRLAAGTNHQLKLFHMQPDPGRYHPESGRSTPADPAWRRHNDPENYRPDECEHCGGDQNFPEEHADTHHQWLTSQDWYTDWDEEGPGDTIHRGIGLDLPDHVHQVVHDESRPVHERARALLSHVLGDENPGGSGLGNFWSGHSGVSKTYAESAAQRYGRNNVQTPVIVHAHTPSREHIETDPDQLREWGVFSYHLAGNREVPVSHGAPLRIRGISWAPPGHARDAGKRDEPPRLEDDPAWAHYEAGGGGIRATASGALSSGHAAEQREALEVLAHFDDGGHNPPCRYCGEPLDDEDVDDGSSAHDECQQVRWCEPHQEHHDDPVEAEGHNDAYTDWAGHLPFEGGIHRGFPVQLPGDVHQAVHDGSRPAAERAEALRSHLSDNPSEGMGLQRRLTPEELYGDQAHLGVHWTDSEPHARGWAQNDRYEGPVGSGPKPSVTHVVLHAASPAREDIEDDPEELERRHMYGFDHDRSEREVPLRVGAPVRLTGISWKRGDEGNWHRHDLADPEAHHAALKATAMDDDDDHDQGDYPGDEDYGYDDEDEDDEESRVRREEEEERDRAHDEAIARTRAALPYVPSPPEGELIDHVHHMHGLDARTTDLHHSPKGRERWHNSEHASHTWQVGRRTGEVPHQHDHLQGIPGERQWPAAFSLSEHTDFAGGTPEHGRFERVLSDPAASRPFAPLMPSESSFRPREAAVGTPWGGAGLTFEVHGLQVGRDELDRHLAESHGLVPDSRVSTETRRAVHDRRHRDVAGHPAPFSPGEDEGWPDAATYRPEGADPVLGSRAGHVGQGGNELEPVVAHFEEPPALEVVAAADDGIPGHHTAAIEESTNADEGVSVVAHFEDEPTGRGGPEGEREPEWHASWGVRPDAECPECNTRADAGAGAEQLHFNIGGQNHPSYLARCQNCETVYNAFKSGQQARVDREFGEQAYKSHRDKHDLQEKTFSHVTPDKTFPLTYWGDERILPGQADRAERQNVGFGNVPYRTDTEQGRAMSERRRRRLFDPGTTVPLDPAKIEMTPGSMPHLRHPNAPELGKGDYRITRMHRDSARHEAAYDGEADGNSSGEEWRGDDDEYVTCDRGHEHYGPHGAAGMLIRHHGDDGQDRYLLQRRSPNVQHGRTWSTPGGALARGEGPEEGAWREAEEELGALPAGVTHHHTYTDDHGGWAYHTVVADSPHMFTPHGGHPGAGWESSGHRWVTAGEMRGLPLHPGFAASWEGLRKSGAIEGAPDPRAAREERGDRWHEFRNRYSEDLHRGIHVELPGVLHGYVHDESVPREERARALERHLAESGQGLGMHWTPHLDIAGRSIHNALDDDDRETEHDPDDEHGYDPDNRKTFVMLHVQKPGERNRLRDPEELRRHEVGWAYSRDEDEFPVKPGTPLRLSGISWKEHDPDHPMEPYEHADFPKPVRHVSSLEQAAPPRGELVIASHITDQVAIPAAPARVPVIAAGAWEPEIPEDFEQMVRDFPGLFRALHEALEALAGRMDEQPVTEEIPAIIRRMALACLTAAEDADRLLPPLSGDPPEGTWQGPRELEAPKD